MKSMKRSVLFGITIGLAVLLLTYTFLRTFTPVKLDESGERFLMYGIMLAAVGIFVLNRKIVAEEQKTGAEQAISTGASSESDEQYTAEQKPAEIDALSEKNE